MLEQTVSTPPQNTRSLSQKISSSAPNQRSHVPKTRYQFYVDQRSLEGAYKNLRTGTRASAIRLLIGLGEKTPYLLVANLVQKPVVNDKDAEEIIDFRRACDATQTGNLAPLSSLLGQLIRARAPKAAQLGPVTEGQYTEEIAASEYAAVLCRLLIEEFQLSQFITPELSPTESPHSSPLHTPKRSNEEQNIIREEGSQ
jgi:hypothetical protein